MNWNGGNVRYPNCVASSHIAEDDACREVQARLQDQHAPLAACGSS
jgi:hypothetical protein